ncbi:MAG TPA: peptidoglycan DD-metalloendopeptidase family protein [Nocardioidaceae bacterium]|nr:peptidoglycan DD-metalloendopeptidase family protein [Nocardioidaceae bacterium]
MNALVQLLLSVTLAGIGAVTPAPTDPGMPVPATGAWPVQPAHHVVEGFDPPDAPWGSGHRGVDLAGQVGEPVHASEGGTVSFAGTIAGVGIVVVTHGDTRTTYEPVAATVRVGQRVARDEVIGRLTMAGSHCLPRACLHWGLIEGAEHYLDPLTLVGGGPVRLLPLA